MENIKDFDSFYTIKIQPYLHEFDRKEQAAANWKNFTMVTGISAVICFILFHFKKFPSGGMLAAALLLMCVTGIYFFSKYADSYIDDFKEKIIGQIISYIHPGTVYKPMGLFQKKSTKPVVCTVANSRILMEMIIGNRLSMVYRFIVQKLRHPIATPPAANLFLKDCFLR